MVQTPPGQEHADVRVPGALAFLVAAAAGTLAGMAGLSGAEFRAPLLITVGLAALQATAVDKLLSLLVVLAALAARLTSVPLSVLTPYWSVVIHLVAGSLIGGWLGALFAVRVRSSRFYRALAAVPALVALALILNRLGILPHLSLAPVAVVVIGLGAGFVIGVLAAIMGVAGGELVIPAIVLLFGVDAKVAGSLALAVSLPILAAAFARRSKDGSVALPRRQVRLAVALAVGSVAGAVLGGLLLSAVPEVLLVLGLAVLLLLSSINVWRHITAVGRNRDGGAKP